MGTANSTGIKCFGWLWIFQIIQYVAVLTYFLPCKPSVCIYSNNTFEFCHCLTAQLNCRKSNIYWMMTGVFLLSPWLLASPFCFCILQNSILPGHCWIYNGTRSHTRYIFRSLIIRSQCILDNISRFCPFNKIKSVVYVTL